MKFYQWFKEANKYMREARKLDSEHKRNKISEEEFQKRKTELEKKADKLVKERPNKNKKGE